MFLMEKKYPVSSINTTNITDHISNDTASAVTTKPGNAGLSFT